MIQRGESFAAIEAVLLLWVAPACFPFGATYYLFTTKNRRHQSSPQQHRDAELLNRSQDQSSSGT